MSAIVQELEKKLKEWPAATAHKVERRVSELIAEVDAEAHRELTPAATRKRDPFFADDRLWDGPTPPDLSANHDKYLYDEP
jgi:hypothetical protein